MDYNSFLETKRTKIIHSGFDITRDELNQSLFPFQLDICHYTIKKGKVALFASTGLGKTSISGEWLYQIWKREQKPVLVLASLAVAEQCFFPD